MLIKNMWNFKINTFCEDLQYAEYYSENRGQYDWHLDIGEMSSSTRKLSISIQLSDPEDYEGGELQFQTGRTVRAAPKEKRYSYHFSFLFFTPSYTCY